MRNTDVLPFITDNYKEIANVDQEIDFYCGERIFHSTRTYEKDP